MAAPQYAILRFAKYKGPEISGIEAHNERTKEKYASNPDIDPTRTHLNFHLIKPERKYRAECEKQIAEAGCRTRSDSVRVVEALITATPEFFKGKKRSELKEFFTPTKGEILVNGKQISEYNIEEYYTLISAVFQEVRAVAFTIFEFVASVDMDRAGAREDVAAALKSAGLWEKVNSLPNGMDTHLLKSVYDDGVELSGGEMQKLLLARAIYKGGHILILDEPTAALDPIAENKLYFSLYLSFLL